MRMKSKITNTLVALLNFFYPLCKRKFSWLIIIFHYHSESLSSSRWVRVVGMSELGWERLPLWMKSYEIPWSRLNEIWRKEKIFIGIFTDFWNVYKLSEISPNYSRSQYHFKILNRKIWKRNWLSIECLQIFSLEIFKVGREQQNFSKFSKSLQFIYNLYKFFSFTSRSSTDTYKIPTKLLLFSKCCLINSKSLK